MTTRTFKISRNMTICNGLKGCGECVKHIPALADDGLMISEPNLARHEKEIENVIMICPAGAIEVRHL